MQDAFIRRAKTDAEALKPLRSSLGRNADPAAMNRVRDIAHALAGSAGLFGLDRIGNDAAALEDAVLAALGGGSTQREVVHVLDRLVASLEREWAEPLTAAVSHRPTAP